MTRRRLLLALGMAFAVVSYGCGPPAFNGSVGRVPFYPHEFGARAKVGASEFAAASVGLWKDNSLVFAVVADFAGPNTQGSGREGGFVEYYGRLAAPDGQGVEWRCRTADGKTGTITINGSSYDLAKGSLFLASARGGKVEVRQVPRELWKAKAGDEGDVLRQDPDVRAFLLERLEAK
ncbi:MAG TPA: hypothetical protein VJ739_12350 [Gemmataceae bacterium]|nr:hypothetical protein [Gemmataceae bacterium]